MRAALLLLLAIFTAHAEWRLALPGWQYEFPRDHGNHPEFKTEWWYFTGNLQAANGREFGYQLTFFRQGILLPDAPVADSHFATRNVEFAHFAISDIGGKQFHFSQRLSRGAFGEAGFEDGPRVAWLKDWSAERQGDVWRIRAREGDFSLDLTLTGTKPPVIQGKDGVSQKADGVGHASHYYSLPRLMSSGTVKIGAEQFAVKGLSWFDHEWASNQLGADQAGWDWLSLHFDSGEDLMLFQLRKKSGGRDTHSCGIWVDANGVATPISVEQFTMEPGRTWQSKATQARYPVEWHITVPAKNLSFTVRAAQDNQELALQPVGYWEGAVSAEGQLRGQPARAKGYLEMTGYAGSIVGLSQP